MRKFLILFSVLFLASCKPEVYLGPLDSPVGNWKSLDSRYYFAGEEVYEDSTCFYTAISFYKDSLCCIEGVKGAFSWILSNGSLIVDSTAWKVVELSGKQMALDYLGIISDTYPDASVPETIAEEGDADGGSTEDIPEPVEYKGKTIETDGITYWYTGNAGEKIPCYPKEKNEEDGSVSILCWWDSRSDIYKPF